jgi:hypothetical protein
MPQTFVFMEVRYAYGGWGVKERVRGGRGVVEGGGCWRRNRRGAMRAGSPAARSVTCSDGHAFRKRSGLLSGPQSVAAGPRFYLGD